MKRILRSLVDIGIHKQSALFVLLFISGLLFYSCNINHAGETQTDASAGVANHPVKYAGKDESAPCCHWTYEVEQPASGEATLIARVRLDSGWHIYSQHIANASMLATAFTYSASPAYSLDGLTTEVEPYKEYDPYLHIELLYFDKETIFKQKIKILDEKDFIITGTIDYKACLTECLSMREDFSFKVKGKSKEN